jgi:23S rRNA (guanosine2251-2'-O)-methyltransferase
MQDRPKYEGGSNRRPAREQGSRQNDSSDSMRRFESGGKPAASRSDSDRGDRGASKPWNPSERSSGARGKPTRSGGRDRPSGDRGYSKAPKEDFFWISGRNPVLEALRAGLKATQLLLRENMGGKVTELIRKEAERRGVPIAHRSGVDMDRMLHHTDHRGVALKLDQFKLRSLDDFLKQVPEEKTKSLFLLLLDGLQDPQNLGAIARTAEVAGVDALVLPSSARAPLSDASFRASAGALAWIPLLEVPFLEDALKELGRRGITRVGLEERLGQPFHEAELERPIAVVVGGEGRGLAKNTIEELDLMIKIPMQGRVGSLNASVAAAIMVYQVLATDDQQGAK